MRYLNNHRDDLRGQATIINKANWLINTNINRLRGCAFKLFVWFHIITKFDMFPDFTQMLIFDLLHTKISIQITQNLKFTIYHFWFHSYVSEFPVYFSLIGQNWLQITKYYFLILLLLMPAQNKIVFIIFYLFRM